MGGGPLPCRLLMCGGVHYRVGYSRVGGGGFLLPCRLLTCGGGSITV